MADLMPRLAASSSGQKNSKRAWREFLKVPNDDVRWEHIMAVQDETCGKRSSSRRLGGTFSYFHGAWPLNVIIKLSTGWTADFTSHGGPKKQYLKDEVLERREEQRSKAFR